MKLSFLALSSDTALFCIAAGSRLLLATALWALDASFDNYDESGSLADLAPPGAAASLVSLSAAAAGAYGRGVGYWDAIHFFHIALAGYTHEHLHAFAPGGPFTVWAGVARRFLSAVVLHADSRPALGLWAQATVVFNAACFGLSAVLLRIVTQRRAVPLLGALPNGKSVRVAFVSLVLLFYIFSPTMLFTSVAYSEAPFALLTMALLWLLTPGQPSAAGGYVAWPPASSPPLDEVRYMGVACVGAVATTVRSNGILLAGFLLHRLLRQAVACWWREAGASVAVWIREACFCIAACFLIVLPYAVAHGALPFHIYCATGGAMLDREGAACPPSWLGMYDAIQAHYWGVGWFAYYTPNNIPNFAIAAPLYATVLYASVVVLWRRCAARQWRQLGSILIFEEPNFIYLYVMLLFALTKMHVQVSNRFVLSCPAIYWLWAAAVIREDGVVRTGFITALVTYSVVFTIIGASLFANFLPWT